MRLPILPRDLDSCVDGDRRPPGGLEVILRGSVRPLGLVPAASACLRFPPFKSKFLRVSSFEGTQGQLSAALPVSGLLSPAELKTGDHDEEVHDHDEEVHRVVPA